eukprot:scaffold1670_cov108-Isochrysis_galbana.AAC.4
MVSGDSEASRPPAHYRTACADPCRPASLAAPPPRPGPCPLPTPSRSSRTARGRSMFWPSAACSRRCAARPPWPASYSPRPPPPLVRCATARRLQATRRSRCPATRTASTR